MINFSNSLDDYKIEDEFETRLIPGWGRVFRLGRDSVYDRLPIDPDDFITAPTGKKNILLDKKIIAGGRDIAQDVKNYAEKIKTSEGRAWLRENFNAEYLNFLKLKLAQA